MGYDIHIERDPPLALDEWQAAVKKTKGVRVDSSGASITNPMTGEVISIGGSDGDAQVVIGSEWLPCFRWMGGSVAFSAPGDFGPDSEVRRLAKELASHLEARLVGDEGEAYD